MDTIRQKAEAIWQEKFRIESLQYDKDLPVILQELQIHQIELELQNEELRATQQQLIAAQSQYFNLYNLAPVGYFTFDKRGIIINVNLTGAQMLHRERRFLVNTVFITHLDAKTHPVFFDHLDAVFTTKTRQSCELALQSGSGVTTYVQIDSVPKMEDNRWLCHSTFANISPLKQTEFALRNAITEKEVLLKELHHRVKNNLQLVSSLLRLQSSSIDDPSLAQLFKEGEHRIKTMSLIHEQLYRSDNLAHIEFAPYVHQLAANLLKSYGHAGQKISLHQAVDNLHFGVDVAIPCGLIVNELVANAIKHAFPNRPTGSIYLTLQKLPNRSFLLSVRDDGVGLPPEIYKLLVNGNNTTGTASLGFQLVIALARQLDADLKVNSGRGTDVRLIFDSTH